MKTRFVLYGFLGWILEVFWTGLSSLLQGRWEGTAVTYLWMFPIYGAAAFLEPLHHWLAPVPWWVRGLVWSGIIFMGEYTGGWLLRLGLGFCPWDYSAKTPYNIDGLIRLDYFPVWFLVGLLWEKFHAALDKARIGM